MRTPTKAALAVTLLLVGATGAVAQDRLAQAQANYQALRAGTRQIGELTQQEQADLVELDRRLRAQQADERAPGQRCVDEEIRREGGTVSALTRRVIEMKCREPGG